MCLTRSHAQHHIKLLLTSVANPFISEAALWRFSSSPSRGRLLSLGLWGILLSPHHLLLCPSCRISGTGNHGSREEIPTSLGNLLPCDIPGHRSNRPNRFYRAWVQKIHYPRSMPFFQKPPFISRLPHLT